MSTLVIVTGASRGIGRSTAVAFAKNPGFQKLELCLIARDKDGLSQTQEEIQAVDPNKDIKSSIYSIDLSNLDTLESNIKEVFNQKFDGGTNSFERAILINNAGSIGHVGPSANMPSPNEMRSIIDFNVTSAIWISSYFVKYFGHEHKTKCNVVNMSSLCAVTPFKTMAMYCAGKAAREMWHNTASQEEDDDLVKVLNYAPGAIETQMTNDLSYSPTLDPDLSKYYRKSREESTLIQPSATAERLVDLIVSDRYKSGDHVDYWDLEDEKSS